MKYTKKFKDLNKEDVARAFVRALDDPSGLAALIGGEPRAFVPANLAYLRD